MRNLTKALIAICRPLLALLLVVAFWGAAVRLWNIPPYVLPSPALTWAHILADLPVLLEGFLQTFLTVFLGFALGAPARWFQLCGRHRRSALGTRSFISDADC